MKLIELVETDMHRPSEKDFSNMADWLYKAFGPAHKGIKINEIKQIVSDYFDELVYEYRDDKETRERDVNKVIGIWMKK